MLDKNFCFDIPAVRGVQAGRTYFTMTASLGALNRLIAFDTGNVLARSQREVNPQRAKKISNYILQNKQSYVLPSLAGVITDDSSIEFLASELSSSVGILRVSMDADILLFDGQHRGTGIIDAVKMEIDIRGHSVPIMLFTGMTLDERQQAFADINGHTVKPSQSISDTYNKRDSLPMLIVDMAKELPAFQERVDFEHNVIPKNSDYLFPVKILKDATVRLTGIKADAALSAEMREFVISFWRKADTPLLWSQSKNWGMSGESFRNEYISSHGVFINALGLFGNIINNQFGNIDKVLSLSKLNIKRNSPDFIGRCIDKVTGKMLSDATAIKLTAIKMLCAVDCPLPPELANLERQYFPETYPTVINKSTDTPVSEEAAQEIPAFEQPDICDHAYAELVRNKFPDLTEVQIDDLCDKYERIVIEFGEGIESAKSEISAMVTRIKKPTTVLSAIRAEYKKIKEGR
ncbi:DNA sulfur modification protein DndB [Vibrio anguillarum]|uniref:DNA sulfur modification protein DndB n=1 Tax=Vibrio anguillarum TaxID=55601 RepID=UPI0016A58B0F|nr:DNA sulfur modification protein DndB [Vibrio anguillarum]NOI06664.1 DGQHR domain-containing protein [Vibrio anguillarum]